MVILAYNWVSYLIDQLLLVDTTVIVEGRCVDCLLLLLLDWRRFDGVEESCHVRRLHRNVVTTVGRQGGPWGDHLGKKEWSRYFSKYRAQSCKKLKEFGVEPLVRDERGRNLRVNSFQRLLNPLNFVQLYNSIINVRTIKQSQRKNLNFRQKVSRIL